MAKWTPAVASAVGAAAEAGTDGGEGKGKDRGKSAGKVVRVDVGGETWSRAAKAEGKASSHYFNKGTGKGKGSEKGRSKGSQWDKGNEEEQKDYSHLVGKGKGRGKDKGKGKSKGQDRGSKPTDDPDFVRLSVGAVLEGKAASYTIEEYVASGTFSRVFRVSKASASRRWGAGSRQEGASGESCFAAKVMRAEDHYIQYTSNAEKEGSLLQTLQRQQEEAGQPVLTMRCFDSFAIQDDLGNSYVCLVLEWLQLSLFDVLRSTGGRGLHLSSVAAVLRQLLQQLAVLHSNNCTHTDIKHKNCCVSDGSHRFETSSDGIDRAVLTNPNAKLIDYGNATFEGEAKVHPIHTKQFRAPEVLFNHKDGWGPASDIWTLGVTAAYIVSGRLLFDSHNPEQLVDKMVAALGPLPSDFLAGAKEARLRRHAEALHTPSPALASLLGFGGGGRGNTSATCGRDQELCLDLLTKLLAPSPKERITAAEALLHPFVSVVVAGKA